MNRASKFLLLSFLTVLAVVMSSSMIFEHQIPRCRTQDSVKGLELERKRQGSIDVCSHVIRDLRRGIESLTRRFQIQEEELKTQKHVNEQFSVQLKEMKKRMGLGVGHAFSAYFDSTRNVSQDQTLVFNKVAYNDHGVYNTTTGVFTVPEDGTFVFSFFVSTRDIACDKVKLTVNSDDMSNAIAKTEHEDMQSQGGNVVILRLYKGDQVSIRSSSDGTVVGSDTNRLTTFSGFMAYEAY